jgi:hypothetical protein
MRKQITPHACGPWRLIQQSQMKLVAEGRGGEKLFE